MEPLVSVIIPTYNRLELLKETVESARNQLFREFEIIVVDDGSIDGTAEWLKARSDIRSLSQANAGIATSRNNGAAIARGRWLAFLDHDDLWDQEKLKDQMEFISENPDVALVAARHVRLGKRFRASSHPKWIKGDLLVKAYSESFIHTSSVMIRKDVFDKIGGFPPKYRFADEFDVWLTIARDFPIAYYEKPLVFIRFYESNTSHNRIGVRTDTYDILQKHYDSDRIPRSIYLRTLSDHDISFGRAYLGAGNPAEALKWFWKSIRRTPFRPRSWRYYLKYRIAFSLQRKATDESKA